MNWNNNNDQRLHITTQTQEKKAVFLRFSKVAGKKCITTVSKENSKKKYDDDGWKLDVMKTQATAIQYYRMNSQNDRWTDDVLEIHANCLDFCSV